jgi:hypothetical protein
MTIIKLSVTATLVIIASFIMSSGTIAAPHYHDQDALTTPSVYENYPEIWDDLVVKGTIVWTDQPEAPSEPNDDPAHAMTVTDGLEITGHVSETADQNDYFKIVLTEQSSVFTELKWSGSAWLNFYIYNADLEPVTYLNENTGSPKIRSMWQYFSGTFYLRVKAITGEADYRLRISIAGQLNEPQNDALETTDIGVNIHSQPVNSVVCSSADPVDYYIVEIPIFFEMATITLDWFGSDGANLDFEVYGPDGVKLITVADSARFETLCTDNAVKGTYYIAVRSVSGRAMYQLMVDVDTWRPPMVRAFHIPDPWEDVLT